MDNKTGETRKALFRTEVISDMVTRHAQKIGALGYNEEFVVTSAEVEDDLTMIEGQVFKESQN